MAKQVINVGLAANDGTGDPLRTAMQKVNLNFTELYNADEAAFSGSYDDLADKPDIPVALTDLDITDGAAGQFLSTDGSGNFSFANTGSGGGATYTNANVDAHINVSSATDDQVLAWTGSDYDWVDLPAGGSGGIDNVVEDTTPQLGGPLDVNGQAIVSASGGNIAITPNADGKVILDGLSWPIADGANTQVLGTNGAGQLTWYNAGGSGGGSSTFAGLTEIALADIDVQDIGQQAKTTYVVTNNGTSAYRFDTNATTDNPTIYVRAGETIAFDLTALAGSHPFQIETNGGAAYSTGLTHIATNGAKTTGANAQGKTSGTLYWKVPAAISGTYEYQCTAHSGMNGDIIVEAAAGASGGGGTLETRAAKVGTTASLANGVSGNLDITGFKSYALMAIQTDKAAWVRIYVNGATRTADASRVDTSDPAPDAGVIAEVITAGAETVIVSPGTIGYNLESTPTTNIPLAVENRSGSAGTVQVTLTVLQLEA